MNEKRRTVIHADGDAWTYVNPNMGTQTGRSSPMTSIQSTSSRGHSWPSAKGVTDIGGDFTTSKIVSLDFGPYGRKISPLTSAYDYHYQGTQYARDPARAMRYALEQVTPSSDASLMKLGATAIARTIPTNPVADAGTFIGELKSGLPKLVGRELFKTKMKDYRKYGSEYLNVEFGWKPLISDLQKFGQAAIESEKIIEQLHRDSGKNIRRKFTFPDEVSVVTTELGYNNVAHTSGLSLYPYLFNNVYGGYAVVGTRVVTKTWFSGCYTYHVNLGNTLPDRIARQAAEARRLFGVELTPATVWNLAPWSWAVDWQGNIGDVLHNVSRFAQDGLVLRYGYIMQKKTAYVSYALTADGALRGSTTEPLRLAVVAESKVRRRATPFGFGFDMSALTGRQSAILGALGISRGPRHL